MEYLSDQALGLLELSQDLIFHTIPKDRYAYYVDQALAYGSEKAKKYCGKDLFELIEMNKITIERAATSGTFHNVRFRAQFIKDGKNMRIMLYQDSMEELCRHCRKYDAGELSLETVEQMHCAHEFFHFLQEKENEDISAQLEKVKTSRLLFWNIYHHVGRTSEIAAHAFAKELLSLPCLPNMYDYWYLLDIGKIEWKDLEAVAR